MTPPLRNRRRRLAVLETFCAPFAWVGAGLATVILCGLLVCVYPFHPVLDPQRRLIHRLGAGWGRTLMGFARARRIQVLGLEQVPRKRPVLFMSNHQSYSDIPLVFMLPFHFRWLAEAGLFRIPIFGWCMRMGGHIPVHRGQPRSGHEALSKAREWLGRRVSIFIFPEGTRSHTGVLGRFHSGGFRLATQTGTPIVPVVVTGARYLLPRGDWVFHWGMRLRIRLLPAVYPSGGEESVRPLMREVRRRIWKAYAEDLKELRAG